MRVPRATYRLQFTPTFTFRDASEVIPYLAALGISDIYASPVFKAKQGTTHGYDVVDPNQLNPEFGTEEDFRSLIEKVKRHKMGWIQDIVPNHMAYDYENKMLMDIFENGKDSEYFDFFDIEWDSFFESLKGRVLAPFLGKYYGDALESKELQLTYDLNGFAVKYHTLMFPLFVPSYLSVLTPRLGGLKRKVGKNNPSYIKLLGILYIVKSLSTREDLQERKDQLAFIKGMLWELYSTDDNIRNFIDETLTVLNGETGKPETFNQLNAILSEQLFRLSFWRVAGEEINYRRFFNINELISLRVRDEKVMSRTHALIVKLVEAGIFTGLRVDHIDGLYDPLQYLKRVRNKAGDLYITVEKILGFTEEIPSSWPVEGTTGYEFMNYLNGIFCMKENAKKFTSLYSSFADMKTSFPDLLYEKKKLIVERLMIGDVNNLAYLFKRVSSKDRHGIDITLYALRRAIIEVIALFPVYRTYISPGHFSEEDRMVIQEALAKALKKNPGLLNELNYMERFLLLRFEDYLNEEERTQWLHFVMRFQQYTGPLMAKGFEDTALYVYNRLLSLNEVGGNPETFGISLHQFHEFNRKRAQRYPYAMNATATHDTKRGEDARARINVLSEMLREWEDALKRWTKLNRKKKSIVNGAIIPDKNDEYFLYQALIGSYPFHDGAHDEFLQRLKDYLIKAVREAKVHTTWINPNTRYEEALLSFADALLAPSDKNEFLNDFSQFHKKVAHYGIMNSLSQVLIKITSPGIPDFYRGAELWDLSFVDPDNRRPVDYKKRESLLAEITQRAQGDCIPFISALFSSPGDGRFKLFLIYKGLTTRTRERALFETGEYIPLTGEGRHARHVLAFARKTEQSYAVTIAPRFLTSLVKESAYPLGREIWNDTRILLPEGFPSTWKDAITDQTLHADGSIFIGDAMQHFPGVLLVSE